MSFIKKIVTDLLEKRYDLSKTQIILPGKRPIIFFKKCFLEKGYQGILPNFYTIEDFFTKYSNLIKIDSIPLWFEAFKIQKQFINQEENLEDFLKWIPALIKDFDDIDIFTEDSLIFLKHLSSIERIENWGESLDSNEEKLYYKHIKFWENNLILYEKLHEKLIEKGLGTTGMILSSTLENLSKISFSNDDTFVFAGLNAITPKEEKIIKHFISNTNTLLYWDTDNYYVKDKYQEAGSFIRKYMNWNYYSNKEFLWIENSFSNKKEISIIGTSQEVAQAKLAGNILKNIEENNFSDTAIVLCDESILSSVIESLPNNINKVNITMGYPLKNSLLASLFKHIFQLQIFREKNKSQGFYFQDVLTILSHPLVENQSFIQQFIKEIKTNNLVFISDHMIYEKLNSWELFFIFKNYENPIDLIRELNQYCTLKFNTTDSEQNIIKENYLKFKNLFSILIYQLSEESFIENFSLLHTIYQHIVNNEKIDFIGEPLEGLQLMGLLETRLLSFKNLIMLGVNEGIIPAGKTENSFIPFDVKKNYNINTFLENDAIYAYHFYRLIQHAENITLLYNNFSEGLITGEKSRFINQLEFESDYNIKEVISSYSIYLNEEEELCIQKTQALQELIKKWLHKSISPTHLTSYLYDPIKFYLKILLQLDEKKEIEEEISPLSYGNLIHNTLEALYSPLKGNYLIKEDLENMLKIYPSLLDKYIKEELNPSLFEKGQNYLQKLLAEKTIEKIISKDLKDISEGNSIFLQDIEKKLTSLISIKGIGNIELKGFVDRWDIFNGQDRIIDYKTSNISSLKFKSEKLNDIRENKNFKFFLQLVFYAHIILKEKLVDSVQVGIWSFKKPFSGLEMLYWDNQNIFNTKEIDLLFQQIILLIQEIVDNDLPFKEKK